MDNLAERIQLIREGQLETELAFFESTVDVCDIYEAISLISTTAKQLLTESAAEEASDGLAAKIKAFFKRIINIVKAFFRNLVEKIRGRKEDNMAYIMKNRHLIQSYQERGKTDPHIIYISAPSVLDKPAINFKRFYEAIDRILRYCDSIAEGRPGNYPFNQEFTLGGQNVVHIVNGALTFIFGNKSYMINGHSLEATIFGQLRKVSIASLDLNHMTEYYIKGIGSEINQIQTLANQIASKMDDTSNRFHNAVKSGPVDAGDINKRLGFLQDMYNGIIQLCHKFLGAILYGHHQMFNILDLAIQHEKSLNNK